MSETDEFAGKQVTVMGLGRFGGGVGVTRFLVDRGADVLVTDLEAPDKLVDSIAKIQDLIDAGSVELRLGEHNVSDFTTCDLVVVNPAVKPDNRFVRAAEAAGIEVTTEMRLLVERLPNRLRTIGVTGSAGKSTVTAMIGHALGKVFEKGDLTPRRQDAKSPSDTAKVWVGGNIGVSLLPMIDQIGEDDWVVLELSSFMLERLKQDDHFAGWSPGIALITNLSENHLDWHVSLEDYKRAKQVILDYQAPGDKAILDATLAGWPTAKGVAVRQIEETYTHPEKPLSIPGEHNQRNAVFVAALGELLGLGDGQQVFKSLADFPGLPHRLQLVAEHNGVRYFNDSKCTTPEAAMLAIHTLLDELHEQRDKDLGVDRDNPLQLMEDMLEGLREFSDHGFVNPNPPPDIPTRKLHVILGGFDKGASMNDLVENAACIAGLVYTIGETGPAIAKYVSTIPWGQSEVFECETLERAMKEILTRVEPGDVVLLSPACASWDQFENYEQRGERFIELINASIGR